MRYSFTIDVPEEMIKKYGTAIVTGYFDKDNNNNISISFPTLDEDEYKEKDYSRYWTKGIEMLNSTYRGKNIASEDNIEALYDAVEKGNFNNIYVGDYISTPDGNNYVVMGINVFKNKKGIVKNNRNHLVLVPENLLDRASHKNADLWFSVPSFLHPYVLGCRWREDEDYNCVSRLLSEKAVFGKNVYGDNENDKLNFQLPRFKLNDKLKIKKLKNKPCPWWLSSVYDVYSNSFCLVSSDGTASYSSADDSRGVVFMIVFG